MLDQNISKFYVDKVVNWKSRKLFGKQSTIVFKQPSQFTNKTFYFSSHPFKPAILSSLSHKTDKCNLQSALENGNER